jgi:hypothetical protein
MTNPTTTDIRHHLVVDNGWDDLEVDDLLANNADVVNADGTTSATYEQWEERIANEPESN